MNILVLTQEYPADDLIDEYTPVVHLFAKEWVAMGHKVKVVDFPTNFPLLYYWIASPFHRRIESLLGTNIRMSVIHEREYILDGVSVLRYPLFKVMPHGRFSSNRIVRSFKKSEDFCNKDSFMPDVIIGHWVNPSAEIMIKLKDVFQVPIVLSMHDDGIDFRRIYKKECLDIIKQIDIWGFRSYPIKERFEKYFGVQDRSLMCFSGVPENYCNTNNIRNYDSVEKFLFVGLLLRRKHPYEYLTALEHSDIKNNYSLDFVGQGDEQKKIEKYLASHPDLKERVRLCGRVSRDNVNILMEKSDVLCMISENEAFGLVYIEAMAAGCITIAARNEGFDGIIVNGENGFLCKAGDEKELTGIINKIVSMSAEERKNISENARRTARHMTDRQVAKEYLNSVQNYMK